MMENNEKRIGPYLDKIRGEIYLEHYLIRKKSGEYLDVSLKIGNEELFVGRFPRENYILEAKMNNGPFVIIYYLNFINETQKTEVIKVLSCINLIDNTFYAMTEKEALNFFDSNINDKYLETPDDYINRSDPEKKRRLNEK